MQINLCQQISYVISLIILSRISKNIYNTTLSIKIPDVFVADEDLMIPVIAGYIGVGGATEDVTVLPPHSESSSHSSS